MVAHISSIAELVHIVRSLFISRMCSAAAITLVMYDWILVFRHEFETIYQSRWSLPKALLLYIRVFTPPCLMITAFTLSDLRPALNPQAWVYIQSFGMLTCLFAANGLLALRLIALYRRKKWLVWFIAAFYLSSYIATFGLVVNSMITYHSSIYYAAPVKSCAADAHSPTMAAIFYAPAAFETFVFFMTVYSAARDSKVITGSSAPFLTVLYRDGLICFVVMIGLRIWNCWIYITQPVSSYNMGTPLMWAVNVVVTTRIYINLVWLAKKPLITTNGLSINADVPASAARASIHVKMPNSQSTFGSWKEPGLSVNNEIEMLQTIPESIFERNLPVGKGFQSNA